MKLKPNIDEVMFRNKSFFSKEGVKALIVVENIKEIDEMYNIPTPKPLNEYNFPYDIYEYKFFIFPYFCLN